MPHRKRRSLSLEKVEKEMADVVGQAEEKERRLNKSRKKLERKLVSVLRSFLSRPSASFSPHIPSSITRRLPLPPAFELACRHA